MPQLHCYVPDDIAQRAKTRASELGVSVSRFLSEMLERELEDAGSSGKHWDEVFGSWEGEPLVRESQGEHEVRRPLFTD